ncbi:toxin-antitoxin system, toxin component [Streptomyces sp. NPDC023998]|uniref:toxin-antitoxin system, toxin component n=1 Tax=Streptomyces sp. NPDC023998 TaxID=3154597 RepID=UPI0033E966E6
MRKLTADLVCAVESRVEVPVEPRQLCEELCREMSGRQGRPIDLRIAPFPEETGVTGLWLAMEDRDIIVVEERADPVQQLVILGHELWHMKMGHCGSHHIEGAAVAARAVSGESSLREVLISVAARSHFREAEESEAEAFGLFLGSKLRPWLTGPRARGPVTRDVVGGRIEASLGYRGQG